MELWEESAEVVNDTEIKVRILGVQSARQTFDFFYGGTLAYAVYHKKVIHQELKAKILLQ